MPELPIFVAVTYTRDQSVDTFEKSLSDTVFQVMQAYWDLVFAIENKKVKDQSLEVALRLLEDTRREKGRCYWAVEARAQGKVWRRFYVTPDGKSMFAE